MDSVEPDTQSTARPQPAKRPAAKRAPAKRAAQPKRVGPGTTDPRVGATTAAPAKRRANGAASAAARSLDPPIANVAPALDLPEPNLPTIVPAVQPDPADTARPTAASPVVHALRPARAEPDLAPQPDVAPRPNPAPQLDPVLQPGPAMQPDLAPQPDVEPEPIVTFVDPATMESVRLPAPSPQPSTRRHVRRVVRVLRHVDTWSVFKVALVFNLLIYGVCLTSGVMLWRVANATGTIDNVERFFEQFGWSTFSFHGGEIFHAAWIGGLFVVVGLTGFAVLLATLFNLISDLVGGIRVSVLETEISERPWSGLRSIRARRDRVVASPEHPDLPSGP